MMTKKFLALSVFALISSGCASSGRTPGRSADTSDSKARVKEVAIVSLIVRNYGAYGTMGIIPRDLITGNMNRVRESTESIIGNYWHLKPIGSFIHDPAYIAFGQGSPRANYYTPIVDGQDMPIFSDDGKQLTRGLIDKSTARDLCGSLAVDAIILVYSEWSIQTGKVVPTIKAVTKNCITMYDKNGKHLFFGRKDTLGPHAIGGPYAGIRINEDTIGHWLEAFATGVETVCKKNRRKLR